MPSTPLPVVLATLALPRRLKRLADMLVPPQITMLDLGEGFGVRSETELAALLTDAGLRPTGRRFSVVRHDLIEAEKI